MHESQDARRPDLEARFAAAGVILAEDRAAGALAAAQRLLEATHWLRRPREPSAEPALVFLAQGPRA